MSLFENLSKNDLVRDLPKMKFSKDKICDACQLGKQHKTSFKSLNKVSTNRALDLLYIDLFGVIDVPSLKGSKYAFVVVDDYTRYTWVMFLAHKNETFDEFNELGSCFLVL